MAIRKRRRRQLASEINVVPYIDVMLVLLIIFMVTAPLMKMGVDIKLPQAAAAALETNKEPVLVSLDRAGNLYLTLGTADREPISAADLVTKLGAFARQNPEAPVLFAGDADVDYGRVMTAMVLLQEAGVPNVGLMTEPPEAAGER